MVCVTLANTRDLVASGTRNFNNNHPPRISSLDLICTIQTPRNRIVDRPLEAPLDFCPRPWAETHFLERGSAPWKVAAVNSESLSRNPQQLRLRLRPLQERDGDHNQPPGLCRFGVAHDVSDEHDSARSSGPRVLTPTHKSLGFESQSSRTTQDLADPVLLLQLFPLGLGPLG